jgi:hypothetical protein
MCTSLKLYYSHSKKIYGTREEWEQLDFLRAYFPDFEIINPNGGIPGYFNDTELFIMRRCLRTVRSCSLVVATEYKGFLGKGVYLEIKEALEWKVPILIPRVSKSQTTFLDVKCVRTTNTENWTRYARVVENGV